MVGIYATGSIPLENLPGGKDSRNKVFGRMIDILSSDSPERYGHFIHDYFHCISVSSVHALSPDGRHGSSSIIVPLFLYFSVFISKPSDWRINHDLDKWFLTS